MFIPWLLCAYGFAGGHACKLDSILKRLTVRPLCNPDVFSCAFFTPICSSEQNGSPEPCASKICSWSIVATECKSLKSLQTADDVRMGSLSFKHSFITFSHLDIATYYTYAHEATQNSVLCMHVSNANFDKSLPPACTYITHKWANISLGGIDRAGPVFTLLPCKGAFIYGRSSGSCGPW